MTPETGVRSAMIDVCLALEVERVGLDEDVSAVVAAAPVIDTVFYFRYKLATSLSAQQRRL